jgi:hypothetical protein
MPRRASSLFLPGEASTDHANYSTAQLVLMPRRASSLFLPPSSPPKTAIICLFRLVQVIDLPPVIGTSKLFGFRASPARSKPAPCSDSDHRQMGPPHRATDSGRFGQGAPPGRAEWETLDFGFATTCSDLATLLPATLLLCPRIACFGRELLWFWP